MAGMNATEKPLVGLTEEQWQEELVTARKMAEHRSPTETQTLRLRAIQTIGRQTGRTTDLKDGDRFPIFENAAEVRKVLTEPFLTSPMQILLYEVLVALS